MKLINSITALVLIAIFLPNPGTAQDQDSLKYSADHFETNYDLTKELNLVYIGASWCKPCVQDSLKQALEEAKITFYERAKEMDMNYSVIGAANNQSVQKGWDFLNNSGYFDEVVIGKQWINSGSLEFIMKPKDVKPAIPQIIVFSRPLRFEEDIKVGNKKILVRKIGAVAIQKWVEEGMPFDDD